MLPAQQVRQIRSKAALIVHLMSHTHGGVRCATPPELLKTWSAQDLQMEHARLGQIGPCELAAY